MQRPFPPLFGSVKEVDSIKGAMNAFKRNNVAEYNKLSWQTIKNWVDQDRVSVWFSPLIPTTHLFFQTP